MNGFNLTTTSDISSSIPQHFLGKKKIRLPDGTELTQEELDALGDTRRWTKNKERLGQRNK